MVKRVYVEHCFKPGKKFDVQTGHKDFSVPNVGI